ncbi:MULTISPECIES: glycoside hydrolase family 73 protein [unclassified Romboutsia]|uniref:glycoside hydrolase family 73 protein n=1 Tax=unclassified Romboutsia TaxID=2626894 RepID=UPI000821208C|nr:MULTISPECIES: glucosaminidase domain-containing protein [unclassified Romboutsia]SCH93869.1 Exo-glucosaminidase lytG precursor [uncultured Clostridium sp.]
MGKKKIKHLKRRKIRKKKVKKIISIVISLIFIIVLVVGLKYAIEMFKAKNIEDSKIEFYMDVADEAGKQETQINWKELLAIDMVIYNNDLSKVKKSEVLNRAKKFLNKSKDENGNYTYTLKSIKEVLNELNFDEKQKSKVEKNLKSLEYLCLGNIKFTENSPEIIFINKIEDIAIKNYNEYKILPSITISQCILESGWGNSELAKQGNNLFGIKADSSWDGEKISMETSENYDDKIIATFRVYPSVDQSIKDHGKFLKENPRYEKNGLFEAKHYTTQAQALEDAGYSTKENEYGEKIYADMLIKLIRKYNLQLVDSKLYR